MEFNNIKKHCERLAKQIDIHIGKGKGKEILSDLYEVTGVVFPDKVCLMDIIETHATGGSDCVFSTWYTDK